MNGEHASFILAAYAISFVVVAGMIVSILASHRTLKNALAKLPARAGGDEA